jgi:phosphoribosylformylglycinamidine (FGAM) synthase-like enzyme
VPDRDGEVELRGYHKPIMIAGGVGNIAAEHVEKPAVRRPGTRWWCSAGRRC